MKRQGRKKEMLFRSQADGPFCQTAVCDPDIVLEKSEFDLAEKLKIIPLGGLNEIGKNMTMIEYGDDIIASYSSLSSATPTESLGALENSLARINS